MKQTPALHIIVGKEQISPCDHQTYKRFKLWVASTLTSGNIATYQQENITIEHWDEQTASPYPYLLNPCECGTFLPIEVNANPMLSSSIGLLSDMNALKKHYEKMEPQFKNIVDSLLKMAELSINTNTALEIR